MEESPKPLDPAVEAEVRARLAALGDVGPMPPEVSARIEAALVDESRLRVARGPLAGQDPDADVLAPLIRSRQRPRPWLAVAAVAAAAAVVAVGGSALHLNKEANPAAVVGVDTTVPGQTAARTDTVHIQLGNTDYVATSFPAQTRAALSHPRPALHSDRSPRPPACDPASRRSASSRHTTCSPTSPPTRVGPQRSSP